MVLALRRLQGIPVNLNPANLNISSMWETGDEGSLPRGENPIKLLPSPGNNSIQTKGGSGLTIKGLHMPCDFLVEEKSLCAYQILTLVTRLFFQ